jgi:plastocyanin
MPNASHNKRRKMKSTAIAIALAFAAGSLAALTGAAATERSITQKNKVFSEKQITVKKGDTVVFVNDDNVSHSVLSTSPGNQFNVGSQAPGVSTPVTFTTAGEVVVICAIHPRMQLTVIVTN